MKKNISFDFNGFRLFMAKEFNDLVEESKQMVDQSFADYSDDFIRKLNNLGDSINILLAIYSDDLGFEDLLKKIKIKYIDRDNANS